MAAAWCTSTAADGGNAAAPEGARPFQTKSKLGLAHAAQYFTTFLKSQVVPTQEVGVSVWHVRLSYLPAAATAAAAAAAAAAVAVTSKDLNPVRARTG